jgi:hypothetical protein
MECRARCQQPLFKFAMAALRWRHIDIFVLETIYADSGDLLHIFLFTIQYAMRHFLSLFTVAALSSHAIVSSRLSVLIQRYGGVTLVYSKA